MPPPVETPLAPVAAGSAETVPTELRTTARRLARWAAEPWLARHRRWRGAALAAAVMVAALPHVAVPAVVVVAVGVFAMSEIAGRRVVRSLVPTVAAAVDAFGVASAAHLVHGFRRSWSRPPAGLAAALVETWDAGIACARRSPDCTDGHDLFCAHRPVAGAVPKPWWPSQFSAFAARIAA